MFGFKKLLLVIWLGLFALIITEQQNGFAIHHNFLEQKSQTEPVYIYTEAGVFSEFSLLPGGIQLTVSVTTVKEVQFKWKSYLPERFVDPFSPIESYPILVQDIRRCLSVSNILFPYHEFL
jgi:hypothetical protein